MPDGRSDLLVEHGVGRHDAWLPAHRLSHGALALEALPKVAIIVDLALNTPLQWCTSRPLVL
jgi:hypothetical protein